MGKIIKSNNWVSFDLNKQYFALPLSYVEGVSTVTEIIAIPNNRSRVVLGLTYILGQIMTVIHIGPICNIGGQQGKKASDVIIVRVQHAYYAVLVDAVGDIVTQPKLTRMRKRSNNFIEKKFIHKKKKILAIEDIEMLIANHICK